MSPREKKWRRIYLALTIFVYVIYVPVSIYEYIDEGGAFPISVIIVGMLFPFLRYNHLKKIRSDHEE